MTTPKILVREFMHPVKYVFKQDTGVDEIVKTLAKNKVVGGPVVDEKGCLIGFISEQDCIKQMLNNTYYCESHDVAADIMRRNPLSVSPEDDILHLAEDMLKKRPKIYPVVENNKIVGMITRADVLKALSLAKVDICSVKR
jgi:DeoR family transcriptional regulator, catabolite repression regulator